MTDRQERLWMLFSVLALAALTVLLGGLYFYAPSLLAPLGLIVLIIVLAFIG